MQLTKLACIVMIPVGLTAFAPATPAFAGNLSDTYLSFSGNDTNTCVIGNPCQTIARAVAQTGGDGVVHCLDNGDYAGVTITQNITIDCSNTTAGAGPLTINGAGVVVHIIGLQIWGSNNSITFQQGAALFVEKCKMFANSGAAITFEPSSGATLYVADTSITGSPSGILIKPLGGTTLATIERVNINGNFGGGIKVDASNGVVSVDLSQSVISYNLSNGVNVVGGGGHNGMVNLSGNKIANNGLVGVQVNGANAAALVDTTLLDSNNGGATVVVAGGRILTYGNNRIVGAAGAGFTGPAALQ